MYRPYKSAETGELLQELAARGVVKVAKVSVEKDPFEFLRQSADVLRAYYGHLRREMAYDLVRFLDEEQRAVVHTNRAGQATTIFRAEIAVVDPAWLPMCAVTLETLPDFPENPYREEK